MFMNKKDVIYEDENIRITEETSTMGNWPTMGVIKNKTDGFITIDIDVQDVNRKDLSTHRISPNASYCFRDGDEKSAFKVVWDQIKSNRFNYEKEES